MGEWKDGIMECWNDGMMECWNDGGTEVLKRNSSFYKIFDVCLRVSDISCLWILQTAIKVKLN